VTNDNWDKSDNFLAQTENLHAEVRHMRRAMRIGRTRIARSDTPPTPAQPTVLSSSGLTLVQHTGTFTDADEKPENVDIVRVDATRVTEVESGGNAGGTTTTEEEHVDAIVPAAGGGTPLALPTGEWHVTLTAITKDGVVGNPSPAVDVEVAPLLTDDGGVAGAVGSFTQLLVQGEDIGEKVTSFEQRLKMWTPNERTTRGPYDETTAFHEFEIEARANYRYLISYRINYKINPEPAAIGNGSNNAFAMFKTETTPGGTPPAPLVASTPIFDTDVLYAGPPTGSPVFGVFEWGFQPSQDERARFMIAMRPQADYDMTVFNFRAYCEEKGLAPANAGRHTLGGAAGTTPDPTSPTQSYEKTYACDYDSHQGWTQFGKNNYKSYYLRHGRVVIGVDVDSRNRTYVQFPSAMLSKIASIGASNVDAVYVYLRVADGHTNQGNVVMGTTTTSNIKQSSEPNSANHATFTKVNSSGNTLWTDGKGYWLKFTTSQRNAVRAGAKGIVLSRDVSFDYLVDFFGTTSSTVSARPQFKMEYRQ
jgi:hypothetical protein